MSAIERACPGISRRSLYRDLSTLGYVASYSHAGSYYTLRAHAPFDDDGIWQYQDVGFSRHGTLKATSRQLVERADAGRIHKELEQRLRVRVHNTLLGLVRQGQIAREVLGPTYLYVSTDAARAAAQLDNRRRVIEAATLPAGEVTPTVMIEVLLEVIHTAGARASPVVIASRLATRGVAVTTEQVDAIFREHGIEKKGARSRSRRSRR